MASSATFSLEHFQGWWLQDLTGQSVPATISMKKLFLVAKLNLPWPS